MPKPEWGTKRVCPTTGKRFYDLNRVPIVSPYTGETVELETLHKTRTMIADKADPASKKSRLDEDSDVVLDDDDDAGVDMELDDDVLDEDDEDNVSLDELTEMEDDDPHGED